MQAEHAKPAVPKSAADHAAPVADVFQYRIGVDLDGAIETSPHAQHEMRVPVLPPVQRKCATCEEDELPLQPKRESPSFAQAKFANRLRQAKSANAGPSSDAFRPTDESPGPANGRPLPKETRAGMEAAFGEDFSAVTIHEDSARARAVNALAFTQGNQIHFAAGQYDNRSEHGKGLLGHELAHVVQQRAGRVSATSEAGGQPVNEDAELEREADALGSAAARSMRIGTGPVRADSRPDIDSELMQFRLPTYANLESVFKDATLAVPESVVINMVAMALTRMKKDGLLLSSDPVADIVKKIFPSPGVIVQAEFEKAVDVTNRNRIYETVLDTNAPIKAADRGKLKSAMQWAINICRLTPTMDAQLQRVFGTKVPEAKDIYKKAGDALERLKATNAAMDAGINVDYNRDDPAMGLGGWAQFGFDRMHLQGRIAEVTDEKDTVITLIHEASHLADGSVNDKGYYPPSTNKNSFAGETEDNKITNAAYFEEFPRRWLALSAYPKFTVFTPGVAPGGGAVTFEDKARKQVTDFFTKAWDAGVDNQFLLRDVQKETLKGNPGVFSGAVKTFVFDVSAKMDLSIHKQAAGKETVTQLDIVLAEGVPRVAAQMGKESAALPVTVPMASDADVPAGAEKLIKDTIAGNKTLLNDPARDRVLLNFLVSKFHSVPQI